MFHWIKTAVFNVLNSDISYSKIVVLKALLIFCRELCVAVVVVIVVHTSIW